MQQIIFHLNEIRILSYRNKIVTALKSNVCHLYKGLFPQYSSVKSQQYHCKVTIIRCSSVILLHAISTPYTILIQINWSNTYDWIPIKSIVYSNGRMNFRFYYYSDQQLLFWICGCWCHLRCYYNRLLRATFIEIYN